MALIIAMDEIYQSGVRVSVSTGLIDYDLHYGQIWFGKILSPYQNCVSINSLSEYVAAGAPERYEFEINYHANQGRTMWLHSFRYYSQMTNGFSKLAYFCFKDDGKMIFGEPVLQDSRKRLKILGAFDALREKIIQTHSRNQERNRQ